MFIPDPNFFHPGSRIQGQKDPGFRVKKIPDPDPLKIIEIFLALNTVSKLS
jgi:hypothetical protein